MAYFQCALKSASLKDTEYDCTILVVSSVEKARADASLMGAVGAILNYAKVCSCIETYPNAHFSIPNCFFSSLTRQSTKRALRKCSQSTVRYVCASTTYDSF